jgi:hypothetical protein
MRDRKRSPTAALCYMSIEGNLALGFAAAKNGDFERDIHTLSFPRVIRAAGVTNSLRFFIPVALHGGRLPLLSDRTRLDAVTSSLHVVCEFRQR